MLNSRIRKNSKKKQVKPLTTNNNDSPHGRFWPDGFRTFLADIIAPFFKENYPALEKFFFY
jgi:hypothetical protein